MRTKTCSTCKDTKPVSEFAINRSKRSGRQSRCMACKKEADKRYYTTHKKRMVQQIAESKARRADQNQTWLLEYLTEHPCVDCGGDDILVLEFDHVRGRKKADVVKLVKQGYSLKTIQKEIAKCVVRCANCHRRRTYIDNGFSRAKKVMAMVE